MKTGIALLVVLLGCNACTRDRPDDRAIQWTLTAAEYKAASMQAYRAATLALPGLLADKNWTAIPYQIGAADLPPAIILDIDQTVVDGADATAGIKPPFSSEKFDDWNAAHTAIPVAGAAEFIAFARESGVRVFFLTNRRCTHTDEVTCVQKPITVDDLIEAGVPAEPADVSLSGERPEWGSEKQTRRDHIAATHRVVMLFGDDLGDFIPCVRARPSGSCTEAGTIDSRYRKTDEHAAYWGHGWYVLPNPIYGSWTTVE